MLSPKLRIASRLPGDKRRIWITFDPTLSRWQQTLPQNGMPHEARFIYRFESRQLSLLRWPDGLYAWTKQRLLRFVWGALAVCLSGLAGILISDDNATWVALIGGVVRLAFILSVLDKFLFDFIALLTGIEQVNRDFREDRWSLMAISTVSMAHVVQAKFAVAQLRAWHSLINVIGLRVFVLLMILLNSLVMPIFTSRDGPLSWLVDVRLRSLDDLLGFVLVLMSFIVLALIYLFEPRWRLRALSAASISISARTNDVSGSLIYAALSFFSVWWTQISAVFVAIFVVTLPSSFLGMFIPRMIIQTASFAAAMSLILTLFLAFVLRQFYHSFATQRLRNTYWQLVKRGGTP